MKVIAVILLGQLALSYAFPLDSGNRVVAKTQNIRMPGHSSGSAEASARVVRGAISTSSSEVGPDGRLTSAALAAKTGRVPISPLDSQSVPPGPVSTGELPPVPNPAVDTTNNNNNPNVPGGGSPEALLPTPGVVLPAQGVGGLPPVPPRKGGVTLQKVASSANMETGTAIATASNGRKRDTTSQEGIETKNVQKVKAQGNKAIATAAETKGSTLNLQQVAAVGGDLAVAKATSGRSEEAPALVARDLQSPPNPNKTVQAVKAEGNKAISKAQNVSKGPGESSQLVVAKGGELALASATNS